MFEQQKCISIASVRNGFLMKNFWAMNVFAFYRVTGVFKVRTQNVTYQIRSVKV